MRLYTNKLIQYAFVAYLDDSTARTNRFYSGDPSFEDLNPDEKTLYREMDLLRQMRCIREQAVKYLISQFQL